MRVPRHPRVQRAQPRGERAARAARARGRQQQVRAHHAVATDETEAVAGAPGRPGQALDEVGQHVELAPRAGEAHRRRQVGHHHHRHRLALAVDAHDPVAERVAQAGVQVEPARIGRVEQRRMAAELEAAVAPRAAVVAGKVAQRRRSDAVVQFLHSHHTLTRRERQGAALMARPRWPGCRSSAGPRSRGGASRTPAGSTAGARWLSTKTACTSSGVT